MLTIKNRVRNGTLIWLAFLGFLAGCGPPGPRALLQGQRLIERGNYARAAEKLRAATSLLATNAQAWNYLGIACQHLGRREEAVRAYERALSLNRDLSEAHYNLGCLRLDENKLDAARAEFTTFTLQRGNSAEGFLKLATVQARSHDFVAAEKSFKDVLRLSPQNPEALNGLGLLRLQARRPAEAQQYFAAALKQRPVYRPALLNSAIVAQEYLHDPRTALARYREYVALKPPPPNAEAVAGIMRELERGLTPPRHAAPAARPAQPIVSSPAPQKTSPPPAAHVVTATKPAPVREINKPASPPKPAVADKASTSQPVQAVKLAPEPVLKPAEEPAKIPPTRQPPAAPVVTTTTKSPGTAPPETAKRGFFERVNPIRVLRGEPKPAPGVTPLPAPKEATGLFRVEPTTTSSHSTPVGPPSRYNYRRPAAPKPGNRREAERLFAQGLQAQRAHHLKEALQAYREATQQDPSCFEAQFYLAFVAAQTGDLTTAMTHYEYALAISPRDANARYNFALVLKRANCLPDAVRELEQVLAMHPKEARAHLALANIYAQQLHETARAREHYLRAVELDPRSPEANDIRVWLRDHAK